ncbi:MAG: uL15 family ribosomal protein [Candidatus Paceibacterota bacterium]|jgi:large subunit ribosomal protein L15
MQSHELKRKHPNKRTKLVGRGSKRGKTSGRGTKGQNARAGHKKRPEIRERIKKIPKLRGYRWNGAIMDKAIVINVGDLNKFEAGAEVTPRTLVKKHLINMPKDARMIVKILGGGEIKLAYKVSHCFVSKSAKEKIEKAGGTVK